MTNPNSPFPPHEPDDDDAFNIVVPPEPGAIPVAAEPGLQSHEEPPPYRPVYNFDDEIDPPKEDADLNPPPLDPLDPYPDESEYKPEPTYRFTDETPDLTHRRSKSRYLIPILIIAILAALGIGAYLYIDPNTPDEQTDPDNSQTSPKLSKGQAEVLHDRIAENRDALNDLIKITNTLNNETAQARIDIGLVTSAVQQVQLPLLAQHVAQIQQKSHNIELSLKRFEAYIKTLTQNQTDVLMLEQQLQTFQRDLTELSQLFNDLETTVDSIQAIAIANEELLVASNATPVPTDPVIRLAVCMNDKLPEFNHLPGQARPDYTEQFLTNYRQSIADGKLTQQGVEIKLAACLDNP